jgi:RES domain-containing protein
VTTRLLPTQITAWRLDQARFAPSWRRGEGAFLYGGRWNSKGVPAVYCSLHASTAILEVAVHKGFRVLDTVPHVLTSIRILEPSDVRIVDPAEVPNANWLRPGLPSAGQQAFGDALLRDHPFVAIPGTVSPASWNLVFLDSAAIGRFELLEQAPFALDTRLHPPQP